MARTQKNKATMGHLGLLKAKLAKLKRELITPKGGGAAAGEGFDVAKTGDARIGFVGKFLLQCFVYFDVWWLQGDQLCKNYFLCMWFTQLLIFNPLRGGSAHLF